MDDTVDLPPNPDAPPSKGILALKPDVVHKICADRVIGSLAIAVKELVENSIDAGATNITVRFKNYGLESVEVADNGKGVQESDFEALTRSYCTSKLADFSDLDSIGTFGFRGEALSSLCRLCEGLIVVTRHATATCASKLEYDSMGKIIKKTPCAGEIGTKIALHKLFAPLPVRRKVFSSKCQQEFNKALHILHAYCIIAQGVKIQIHHQRCEGKDWLMLVGTRGGKLKDNLGSVVGYKSLTHLLPFPGTDQSNETTSATHANFQLQGYISSCAHGAGRRTPDKQYFYINGRPCDLPKVSRLVNQLYRQFNKHQAPLVVLNVLSVAKSLVDVNLAPDKRTVVLKSEAILLDLIKTTLLELYEHIPSTMIIQTESVLTFSQGSLTNNFTSNSPNTSKTTSVFANLSKFALGANKSNQEACISEDDVSLSCPSQLKVCDVIEPSEHSQVASSSVASIDKWSPSVQQSTSSPLRQSLDRFRNPRCSSFSTTSREQPLKRAGETLTQETKYQKLDSFVLRQPKTGFSMPGQCEVEQEVSEVLASEPVMSDTEVLQASEVHCTELESHTEEIINVSSPSVTTETFCVAQEAQTEANSYTRLRREVLVPISLEKIKAMTITPKQHKTKESEVSSSKFTAPITAVDAEREICRENHKEMFLKDVSARMQESCHQSECQLKKVPVEDVTYVKMISKMSDKEWWDHIKNRPTLTTVLDCYGWAGDDTESGKTQQEPEYIRRRRIKKKIAEENKEIIHMIEKRLPRTMTSKKKERSNGLEKKKIDKTQRSDQLELDTILRSIQKQTLEQKKSKEEEELNIKKFIFEFQSSVCINEKKMQECISEGNSPLKIKFFKVEGKAKAKALEEHLTQVKENQAFYEAIQKNLEAKKKTHK